MCQIEQTGYLVSDHKLSLSEAVQRREWITINGHSANFGFDQRWYWFRFDLPAEDAGKDRVLQIGYPLLDSITLYLYRGDELLLEKTLGSTLPISERDITDSTPAFLIPAELQADHAYLEVYTNSSVQVSLNLYSEADYWRHRTVPIAADAAVHAILWVMLAYNLLIFLLARNRAFLLYSLSIVSISFMLANLHGWTFRLFWPETPQINDRMVVIGLTATEVFTAMFGLHVLRLKTLLPTFYNLFRLLIAAALLSGIGGMFLPYSPIAKFQTGLGLVMTLTGLVAGIKLIAAREVLLYFIALFSLISGMLILTLKNFGVLPVNLFTSYGSEVGYVLQVIFYALSIGDRHLRERQARIAAQDVVIAMQREANESLEQKVRERTADLRRANIRLQEESTTDALTQVRNRRSFDQAIYSLCESARQQHQPIALLLIDIDHFKQFNDLWGHQTGDVVLQQVASSLELCLRRSNESLFRYGGEEFAAIITDCDEDGAMDMAEVLRQRIAALRISVSGEQLRVTISVGVCSMTPSEENSHLLLCENADLALYRAKDNGRDIVSA